MNKLKAFVAVLLTVVTLTHTQPSQAAIGAAVATPVLIAGLVIGGAGVIGTTVQMVRCGNSGNSDMQGVCAAFTLVIGVPVILLGLIVLDGEQQVEFRELNQAEANKLKVSQADLAVYHSEIDQANMLVADVKAELSKIAKPTAQDSEKAWSSVKDLVSPETFETMQKIVSQK